MSESCDEGQLATDQATDEASTEPETLPEEKRSDSLTKWGVVVSIGYLTFLAILGGSNINGLLSLHPNEFGDMLAGIFSPLAFLWLVLGFLQQGQELRASVRALELQGRELSNSVDQQRQLVTVARDEMVFAATQFEEQRAAEDRKSQPVFSLRLISAHPHPVENGVIRCEIELRVSVNDAWQLCIWDEGNRMYEHERFQAGNFTSFQFKFPKDKTEKKALDINYVDMRGVEKVSKWMLLASHGNISIVGLGTDDR